MSEKEQAAPTDPEFFPENVEFLGFIGGWDCYIGIDRVHTLFYLIRTNDLDWLEVVVKSSNEVISRKCEMSIPRRGSKREAAARLREELYRFDDLWSELFPAEHARIVQLLVDRVDISETGADITLRIEGLASLMQDLRTASERKTVAA